MEITNKAGKYKKKWLSFDDVAPGFTFNRGKEACNKSKNYIMSLKASRFTKLRKKPLRVLCKNLILTLIVIPLFGRKGLFVINKGL